MIDWEGVRLFAIKSLCVSAAIFLMAWIGAHAILSVIEWPSVSIAGHDLFDVDTLDRLADGAGQPNAEQLKAMLGDERKLIRGLKPYADLAKEMFR